MRDIQANWDGLNDKTWLTYADVELPSVRQKPELIPTTLGESVRVSVIAICLTRCRHSRHHDLERTQDTA